MTIRETDGLGTLVKRYRAALGLTQEELAERAGVSARSISDLERDLSRTPYPGTIRRLADAFELTPEQRTAFMVAGVRPRDGDDVPTVLERPGPRAGLGLFRRPVVVGALLFAALVVAACTVLITRGSGGGAPQARVYSTPRVPALLDSWGVNLEKIAAFEPNSVDMAVGPPGYEYAVETNVTPSDGSYNVALRFSPNGQALGVWPVSDQSSGVVGAATDADGNLWITTGAGVRQYSSYGRLLGTWNSQGVNPGQFAGPEGIAIAGNGDVIVGEADTHQVQVFTHEMKPIRQWSGPGGAMQSFQPDVMAVDAQNDVYILDTGNWQIEKYTLQGKRLGILRPPGLVKLPAEASGEADLTVDGDGNVYAMVSTESTLAIEKLRSDGKEIGRWTSVGPHRAVSFGVDSLRFAGTVGYLSVTDGRVLKVDQRMHVLTSWTVQQLRRPLFHSHPVAIAAGSAGQVYVADGATREVIGLSSRSGLVARWKTLMVRPSGPLAPSLAVEPGGDVVVADGDGTRIETYSPDGKLVRRSGVAANSGSSLRAYTGLGIDGNSNLSVLTYPQGDVETFSSSGRLLHSWCPGCNIPGAAGVLAMIVSRTGKVYVAAGSMVVEFTPVGVPVHSWNGQTITGSGPVIDVAGIAVDSQGNLYVSDLDNNALEVFSPSGRRRAFWTSLSPNGPALSDLGPVAVDGQGNIFLVNGKSVLELAPLRAHE